MERDPQHITATIVGCAFIVIGIIGFLFQGMLPLMGTATAHNTLRLLLGGAATVIGVWGTVFAARVSNRVLGMALLLFALLGFLYGDATPLHLGLGDNILHLLAGGACVMMARVKR